ncbi:major facilitator superfamily MFS-1 [Exidia glandulosa HHB12029]|uniref:Major facilitator superfamily MFS-1 n=1 Tax=Exidia glandulosa HHB12029 TaxID=1314781 RepID=A0A165DWY7_EXIGL|nr:major facilitator superfamily MFS-1 [Exidia glandulosa HHB12029]
MAEYGAVAVADDVEQLDKSEIPIPSALPIPHVEATPLPIVPLTVLSITVMGEFLCANVSTPFLLFMVRDFGIAEDEAAVGYWTGILVSVFFLTQFATSLLWAALADVSFIGRRNVLFVSLLGSTLTCTVFGTARSFGTALAIRLVQGVFAGAIGVARSGVASVTDETNEGRAYAIMGFAWGLGGVFGAVIGGTFESPADKWPALFKHFPLFTQHPYLLPCALAASVTLAGAAMCVLLDHDGLPRKPSTSSLPPDPEVIHIYNRTPSPSPMKRPAAPLRMDSHTSSISHTSVKSNAPVVTFAPPPQHSPPSPSSVQPIAAKRRRSSAAQGGLSATTGTPLSGRMWMHRRSSAGMTDASEMNLAERLIAANENQVTSMAQLWVAAAMSTEVAHEEALEFESDTEDVEPFPSPRALVASPAYLDSPAHAHASPAMLSPDAVGTPERRPLLLHRSSTHSNQSPAPMLRNAASNLLLQRTRTMSSRAMSSGSRRVPMIFANAGVQEPFHASISELPDPFLDDEEDEDAADTESIATEVPAGHQVDVFDAQETVQPPSALSQIPKLVVLQYGLLALHTTTHDQVFYSYLMTRFEAGGLGLDPGAFAQLIAIMSVAQVVYQFWMYPTLGPPRGSFSHLSMFRLGSLLFLPSYLTVVFYRGIDDGWVMPGLIASTAVRYCATTFAFTSITILLNYLTPPPALGLANGLAQSMASLARFVGPALGAKVWEASVRDDPNGYALGFWVCAAVCASAWVASFTIR